MAVIGTGLIGTSVALAARRAGVGVHLADRDPVAARTAAALGAGTLRPPAGPVDLAVIAVPPSRVGEVLLDLQRRGAAEAFTDVASVKAEPERAVLRLAPDPSRYIGGHPLAGRERSGPLAARAELFRGRSWALSPSRVTSSATFDRALELIDLCGAVPFIVPSRTHDATVALTSHVPHLLASLMAARLPGGPAETGLLAGQGLRDVTRIAGGDPGLWGDILRSNAPALVGVARELHADLARLVAALEALADPAAADPAADPAAGLEAVLDLLRRGRAGLDRLPAPGGLTDPAPRVRLRVAVAEHPGELARLLETLTGLGLPADEAAAGLDPDGTLTLTLPAPAALAPEALAALTATGRRATLEAPERAPVAERARVAPPRAPEERYARS
jgi:prephenate dehydrogenase